MYKIEFYKGIHCTLPTFTIMKIPVILLTRNNASLKDWTAGITEYYKHRPRPSMHIKLNVCKVLINNVWVDNWII